MILPAPAQSTASALNAMFVMGISLRSSVAPAATSTVPNVLNFQFAFFAENRYGTCAL